MAMKLDELVAQALALPATDRAKVIARLQASLPLSGNRTDAKPIRLLDLAGTGQGLWGDDSTEYLRRLRNEWS